MPFGTDTPIIAPDVAAGIDHRPLYFAVFENALRAVDILREGVQRKDTLREAAFDTVPFRARQNTRHQIKM
jgi:hypothetical protein